MCQEEWREHMKKEHKIGQYCELCNEYCLFKDDLEEHMESHVTEVACEEDEEDSEGIECDQCYVIYKTEEEFIEHENDGQECDQCREWLCYGIRLEKHKKKEQCDQCGEWLCNKARLSTHKKREHENTSEEGKKARKFLRKHKKKEHEITSGIENKDKDKETQVMEIECEKCNEKFESVDKLIEHVREIECVECNEKFVSVDKLMEHVNENECDQGGKWLCCGTYLRKHKKREHEIINEKGSKEEVNKKDSNEDEEKGEIGTMVCDLSNQPD